MISYDGFLSRAGERMQQSAIRQMGTVAAQRPDLISFAPGYPSPDTFAWEAYRDIAASVLAGTDSTALQYGPTRGYGPLLDTIVGLLADLPAARGKAVKMVYSLLYDLPEEYPYRVVFMRRNMDEVLASQRCLSAQA